VSEIKDENLSKKLLEEMKLCEMDPRVFLWLSVRVMSKYLGKLKKTLGPHQSHFIKDIGT
jgi:hypothetical protein